LRFINTAHFLFYIPTHAHTTTMASRPEPPNEEIPTNRAGDGAAESARSATEPVTQTTVHDFCEQIMRIAREGKQVDDTYFEKVRKELGLGPADFDSLLAETIALMEEKIEEEKQAQVDHQRRMIELHLARLTGAHLGE